MTDKTCQTCKHWKRNGTVNYGGDMKECGAIQGGAFGSPPAMVYDGDGQITYGFLATHGDFGCKLWRSTDAD